jgi:predicted nucleotidyltransferase component of viral defense system
MIPKAMITEWREYAPWVEDAQVEQDLLLSQVLVGLFSNKLFRENVAFRGGTALFKLYMTPAFRYSEDLDFVQIKAGPIGDIVDVVRQVVDPILGKPKRNFNHGRATLLYSFLSESTPPIQMRLKIEINTREHFTVFGYEHKPFSVQSRWFKGDAEILTYSFDELMGTKLRALYQRKKGRDLFDLWVAYETGDLDMSNVISSFLQYMEFGSHGISRALFEQNIHEKLTSTRFLEDIGRLLAPGINWDHHKAAEVVKSNYISLIPGQAWAGPNESG